MNYPTRPLTGDMRSRLLRATHTAPDEWDDVLLDLTDRYDVTADVMMDVALLVGRGPAIPAVEFLADYCDDDALREVWPVLWQASEFPSRSLGHRRSVELWRRIGYTVDGEARQRPDGEVTLYRAAADDDVWGLSWTADLEVAETFMVYRNFDSHPPTLWSATFPWSRVLGQLHGRGECEVLVDAAGPGVWRETLTAVGFDMGASA